MSRYDRYERDYDSDDSTLVNEDRYRRRSRRSAYRSPSEDSSSPRRSSYDEPLPEQGRGGLGKVTLAAGLLVALAGFLHFWNIKKREEREREERHRRREKFAKAKAARRKEEARRERQRRQDDEYKAPSEVLRIGYAPARAASRSRPRGTKMIEESPPDTEAERDGVADKGYENDLRSRRGR